MSKLNVDYFELKKLVLSKFPTIERGIIMCGLSSSWHGPVRRTGRCELESASKLANGIGCDISDFCTGKGLNDREVVDVFANLSKRGKIASLEAALASKGNERSQSTAVIKYGIWALKNDDA